MLVTAQTRNSPNIYPQINEPLYIYTIEQQSAIKGNKFLINTITWMTLSSITLGKSAQGEKVHTI